MFCQTRSRSRSRTGNASVTTLNGAGDVGRKASPILLHLHPSSPPERLPRARNGDAVLALGSRPLSVQTGQSVRAVVFGAIVEDANDILPSRLGASSLTPSEP